MMALFREDEDVKVALWFEGASDVSVPPRVLLQYRDTDHSTGPTRAVLGEPRTVFSWILPGGLGKWEAFGPLGIFSGCCPRAWQSGVTSSGLAPTDHHTNFVFQISVQVLVCSSGPALPKAPYPYPRDSTSYCSYYIYGSRSCE